MLVLPLRLFQGKEKKTLSGGSSSNEQMARD